MYSMTSKEKEKYVKVIVVNSNIISQRLLLSFMKKAKMSQSTNSRPYADDSSEDENNSGKFVSCNTIRKKINLFLATKELTQTAFLKAIGGVNSNSFGRFMKLKGPYSGCDNGTYEGARNFFDRREKKRKADMIEAKERKKSETKATKSALSKRPVPSDEENSSDVAEPPRKIVAHDTELPEDLPVFDDCDEVRTKIGQCFHKKELSQAGFAKAIGMTPGTIFCYSLRRCIHFQGFRFSFVTQL